MKVLVTGATGFIGRNLVSELLGQGDRVLCLYRDPMSRYDLYSGTGEWLQADLASPLSLRGHLSKIEVVYHVAGVTSGHGAHEYDQGNVETTRNLLQQLVGEAKELKCLVYVSSLAAAGPCAQSPGLSPEAHAQPVSAYGRSKLAAEQVILKEFNTIPSIIVRPPIVYGPYDQALLPLFKAIRTGIRVIHGFRPFPVSLIHVEDLVSGLRFVSSSKEMVGRRYHISDGGVYPWQEIIDCAAVMLNPRSRTIVLPLPLLWLSCQFAEMIGRVRGKPLSLNRDKWSEIKQAGWVGNGAMLNEQGFTPAYRLEQGLSQTIEWYKTHGWL